MSRLRFRSIGDVADDQRRARRTGLGLHAADQRSVVGIGDTADEEGQQGVVVGNGLKRYQGRLNANHDAFEGKLRLAVNLMAARVNNQFAPLENGGGFTGGLFTNMVIYNPTLPIIDWKSGSPQEIQF